MDPQGNKTLFIAGPFEFSSLLPEDAHSNGPAHLAKYLTAAYSWLNYSLGYLAPADAQWLQMNDARLPSNWMVGGSRLRTAIKKVKAGRVGFILLPTLPDSQKFVSEDQYTKIQETALKLRQKVSLVVGISPWGYLAEKKFLDSHPPLFDILLGGGKGPGLGGRLTNEKKTLWLRAYSQGRAVSILHVISFPDRKAPHWEWQPGHNIIPDYRPLRDDIPHEPQMVKLLQQHFPNAR